MKTIEEYFRDWEQNTFGFGYGTGEEHILPLLRHFFSLCEQSKYSWVYDYTIIEKHLDPAALWLLINALCKVDIIEYGTSPRYAWLTDEGVRLREFMLSKTDDELYDIVTGHYESYVSCAPSYCNCADEECHNPFWINQKDRELTQF